MLKSFLLPATPNLSPVRLSDLHVRKTLQAITQTDPSFSLGAQIRPRAARTYTPHSAHPSKTSDASREDVETQRSDALGEEGFTCVPRGSDVDDRVPEPHQRKDKAGAIIKGEGDGGGMDEGVGSVNGGGYLWDLR